MVSAVAPGNLKAGIEYGGESSQVLISVRNKSFFDIVCRTNGVAPLVNYQYGIERFTFSNPKSGIGDRFGESVAANQHLVVIGAPGDDDSVTNSGAVYIYSMPRLNSANIYESLEINKIKAPTPQGTSSFGASVAIGSNRIVVGEFLRPGGGAAYIYDLAGNFIRQLTPPPPNALAFNANYGISVAIACGKIIVGARGDNGTVPDSGSAYIFDLDGIFLRKIQASNPANSDQFGQSVAIGSNRIVVGAPGKDGVGANSGTAYIYDIHGNFINEITDKGFLPSSSGDRFGQAVSAGFNRIVVGAPEKSVNYGGSPYNRTQPNGNPIPVQSNSGAAYIYSIDGEFVEAKAPDLIQVNIVNSDPIYKMANSKYGSSLATGGWDFFIAGAPECEIRNSSNNSTYQQNGYIEVSVLESDFPSINEFSFNRGGKSISSSTPEQLGYSVAVSGRYIISGAPGYNGNIGRAYFQRLSTIFGEDFDLPNNNPRHILDLLDENK
jgi:hypothetical protein